MNIVAVKFVQFCLVIIVLTQTQISYAQVTTWGTYAETSIGQCSTNDCADDTMPDETSQPGPVIDAMESAPAISTVANSVTFVPDRGAKISADFKLIAPGLVTPVFSGNSKARSIFYAQAQAQSLMYYTYTGSQSIPLTITADMNAIANGPFMVDHCCDGAQLSFSVFTGVNALALDAAEQGANLTCLDDCYTASQAALLEFDEMSGPASAQLTFDVQPGEGFYLHARLDMTAFGGGEVRTIGAVRFNFNSTELVSLLVTDGLDSDGDNVIDAMDNCTLVHNPPQVDSNSDGFGNRCDASFSESCGVTYIDYSRLTQSWSLMLGNPLYNPDHDLDSNGVINFLDIAAFPPLFLRPPGPSTVLCVKP